MGKGTQAEAFFIQEESRVTHTHTHTQHTHNAFGLLADAWNMTLSLHDDVRELGNKN